MTLWELAPFQVRSSVLETESYLMRLQKRKGKLRHQSWVGETAPLGWQEEPGWGGGSRQCTCVLARVHKHTHTHPMGLLAALHQRTSEAEKHVLCRVECSYELLLIPGPDSGNRKHHGYVRRSYFTFWAFECVYCNIWGLDLQKLSSLGNSLLGLHYEKATSLPIYFFSLYNRSFVDFPVWHPKPSIKCK